MMKKVFQTNESGQTLITVVLVISAVSALFLVSMGISSRAFLSLNENFELVKVASAAVEGSMSETLRHRAMDLSWPGVPNYQDQYYLGAVLIERDIVSTDDETKFEVTGTYRGVVRKLQVIENKRDHNLTFNELIP